MYSPWGWPTKESKHVVVRVFNCKNFNIVIQIICCFLNFNYTGFKSIPFFRSVVYLMAHFCFRRNKKSKLNHSDKRKEKLSSLDGSKEYL